MIIFQSAAQINDVNYLFAYDFLFINLQHMERNIFKIAFSFIISILFITSTIAQQVHEPKIDSDWVKPYPPFRIAGNLYYVGTYDLDAISSQQKKETY